MPVVSGAKISENNSMTELSKILLNIMPKSWRNQAYFQGFYYESIAFKSAFNIFERMKITESIYEGVVEHSYKNVLDMYIIWEIYPNPRVS